MISEFINQNLLIDMIVIIITLVQNSEVTCALYYDKIAKIFVQVTKFRTEILNKHGHLSSEHAEYIINALHDIRNNIVILMGKINNKTKLNENILSVKQEVIIPPPITDKKKSQLTLKNHFERKRTPIKRI